jgi:hypothetical protein
LFVSLNIVKGIVVATQMAVRPTEDRAKGEASCRVKGASCRVKGEACLAKLD